MSIIKSYSVGNGDMFYIEHNSDNFTIIDCCLAEGTEDTILAEVARLSASKGITRFISTHPDEDHILGLKSLDDKIGIVNFYVVKNSATKNDVMENFTRYCKLRDSERAFNIVKGCARRWMNRSDEERKTSGIEILWPDPENEHFKDALVRAKDAEAFNNISPIVKYGVTDGPTVLWMGDMETEFMEAIEDHLELPHVDILFAPHHGRDSGKVPATLLEKMSPKIIVIGEAPSEHLNYYAGYNTITQNTAGDIVFDCVEGKCHVFTLNEYEAVYLVDEAQQRRGMHYAGTLNL
jgi:beta-lactamase superfamily II metal-dependent hydrolase